jgi:nitric oxide reductase NorE protein
MQRDSTTELLESWSASAEQRIRRRAPTARRHFAGRVPGEVGVWVFVLGDMCVFGWFFCVFMYEHAKHLALFDRCQESLTLGRGLANTLLLVTSSLFVALGVRAMRLGMHRLGPRLFIGALLCGLAFIANKYFEYSSLIHAGHGFGANEFYAFFFILTGIHLLHLTVGCGVLLFMCRVARRRDLDLNDYTVLESGASYWHLIDLLWIVLFALFYLVR